MRKQSDLRRALLSGAIGSGVGAASGAASEILSSGLDSRDIGRAAITGALIGGGSSALLRGGNRTAAILGGAGGISSAQADVRETLGQGRGDEVYLPQQMMDYGDEMWQDYYSQSPEYLQNKYASEAPPSSQKKKASMSLNDLAIMEKVSGHTLGRLTLDNGCVVVEDQGRYTTYDKTGAYTYGTFDTLEGAKTAAMSFNQYSMADSGTGRVARRGFFGLGPAEYTNINNMSGRERARMVGSRSGNRIYKDFMGRQNNAPTATSTRPAAPAQPAAPVQQPVQPQQQAPARQQSRGPSRRTQRQNTAVRDATAETRARLKDQYTAQQQEALAKQEAAYKRRMALAERKAAEREAAAAGKLTAAETRATQAEARALRSGRYLKGGIAGLGLLGGGYLLNKFLGSSEEPQDSYSNYIAQAGNYVNQAMPYVNQAVGAAQQMGYLGGGAQGAYQQMPAYGPPQYR